jgi:hypothetical protein
MVHPILQSGAEMDKPEPFFLNKWKTKPVEHPAARTAGKARPGLKWRNGIDKRALSGSGFRVYVSCCIHAGFIVAPPRL